MDDRAHVHAVEVKVVGQWNREWNVSDTAKGEEASGCQLRRWTTECKLLAEVRRS